MKKNALITLCLVVAVDAASFGILLPVVPFLVNQLTGSFNPVSVTGVLAAYSGLSSLEPPSLGDCQIAMDVEKYSPLRWQSVPSL